MTVSTDAVLPTAAADEAAIETASASGEQDDLRGRVVRAFGWNMTSQAVRQVTRITYGIAMARLLTPHEYGLAGMALVFASLWIVFSDLGFGAALIQRQHVTERDRSTVFWTTTAIGLLMTLSALFLAGPVAHFYGQPSIKPLFQLMSVVFVVGALGMTQASILQRELDFKSLEMRIMAAIVAGALVGIGLAAAGFGPYALIANELTVSVVSTTLMWFFSGWRPGWQFSWQTIRDFGPFSANLVAKSFLDYAGRNSDNILIGRYLGSAALGAYAAAYNMMLLPIRGLVQPIQETLFPALSRMQDEPGRLAAVWFRATRAVLALIMPAMLGLIAVAPDLVPTLLGDRWHRVVPVVQILGGVAVLQSATLLGVKVLTARGETKLLLRYTVVFYATAVPAFVLGLRWGINGVAACYAVINLPMQCTLLWLSARNLRTTVRAFGMAMLGVAIPALAMFAGVAALRLFLVAHHVARAERLPLTIAAGILLYIPFIVCWSPETLDEYRRVLRRPARRRSRAAAARSAGATDA